MRVPSAEIEKAMGKGDVRYYLNYVHFDRDERVLVATNGHILACLKLAEDEILPEDTTGAITEEALKAARKGATNRGIPVAEMLKANGALEVCKGPSFPRPTDEEAGKFPDWKRVIPNREQLPGKSITFNVDLLANLTKAICDKSAKYGPIVTLHLPWNSRDAILVTPDVGETEGRVGVLMPARGKDGDCDLFEKPKAAPILTPAEVSATARKAWKAAWRRARIWIKNGRKAKPRNRLEEIACSCAMGPIPRHIYCPVSAYGALLIGRLQRKAL